MQHSVLLPLLALTKVTKPLPTQGISKYLVSLVFNCGSGTHSIDSTHPQLSRINLLEVTSGTSLAIEEATSCCEHRVEWP